jgi:hypothetical protein
MAQVFFHCSRAHETLMQGCSIEVGDLVEAHHYAACVINALIMEPNSEDWRGWVLHISDDAGYELLSLPFASMLGKPH